MRTKQSGIVLIVALIFLQIFTLLGILVMESSLIENKMAQQFQQKYRVSEAAEHLLSVLEKQNHPQCVISMKSTTEIRGLLRNSPCQGEYLGFRYYYLDEFLGVLNSEAKKTTKRYDRLSVMVVSHSTKMTLQSTLIKEDNNGITTLRRQSWRELIAA